MSRSARRTTTPIRALVALLSLALAACDTAGVLGTGPRISGSAEESIGAGLVQTVTVRPAALLDGNDVEVRSVIQNRGTLAVALTSRVCGLDYGGTLELVQFLLYCAIYSEATQLAPGDSVVNSDVMRVVSPPGSYELRVRHAIEPEHWVAVPTVVRD